MPEQPASTRTPDWKVGSADLVSQMVSLRAGSQPFALCVVAHTEGSTYRKPGAVTLISAERRAGVISGGCLESDLEIHARQAIAAQQSRCVIFDTLSEDDLLYGSGSGCRGRVHVLILPDCAGQRGLVDALLAADAAHVPLELALCIDGPQVGSGVAWVASEEFALAGGAPGLRALRPAAPGTHTVQLSGQSAAVARFAVPAVARLLILGAGPEAAPLLQIARTLGWRSLVADHRPAAVQIVQALAEETIVARPASALARFGAQRVDACLIMSHIASCDLEALRALATHPVRYIGLLGPPARRDELLRLLTGAQRSALQGRLQAPVGIRLGGHGPEPLALSIAAQLQQQFSERS